jgi:hypothetical protein
VTEYLLHDLDIDVRIEHQGGGGVPRRVET